MDYHSRFFSLPLIALTFILSLGTKAFAATCTPGVYSNKDGSFFTVTRSQESYRTLSSEGLYAVIDERPDGVRCQKDAVSVAGKRWTKQNLSILNTEFMSEGARLKGQLVMPVNATKETPLVVYAHGSEALGWIESALEPYQLVARGISVFVFDKRGTGISEGKYTQNFPLLAKDIAAAAKEANLRVVGLHL